MTQDGKYSADEISDAVKSVLAGMRTSSGGPAFVTLGEFSLRVEAKLQEARSLTSRAFWDRTDLDWR